MLLSSWFTNINTRNKHKTSSDKFITATFSEQVQDIHIFIYFFYNYLFINERFLLNNVNTVDCFILYYKSYLL